jgi:hypothetical protein
VPDAAHDALLSPRSRCRCGAKRCAAFNHSSEG